MKIKGSISFFVIFATSLFILSPPSLPGLDFRLTAQSGTSLSLLTSKAELLSSRPQMLLALESGLSFQTPALSFGIYAGSLGAVPSRVYDDFTYRGFSGVGTGLEFFYFPRPAEGKIGFGGGLSGNLVSYDYTYQWFFFPALHLGGIIRLDTSAGSPVLLELFPKLSIHFRRDLSYSFAAGIGIRMHGVFFSRTEGIQGE